MSIEGTQEVIRALRNVELRRAVHGVDPAQVRDLLDEAADTLASAAREQTELRDHLKRLQAANDASPTQKNSNRHEQTLKQPLPTLAANLHGSRTTLQSCAPSYLRWNAESSIPPARLFRN